MALKKNLVIHAKIELDKTFIQNHNLDECINAVKQEIEAVVKQLYRYSAAAILEVKTTGRLPRK